MVAESRFYQLRQGWEPTIIKGYEDTLWGKGNNCYLDGEDDFGSVCLL